MSASTLQRVEQNDPFLVHLLIFTQDRGGGGIFPRQNESGYYSSGAWPSTSAEFTRLGNAIATNTHLKKLSFGTNQIEIAKHDKDSFFSGLRRNVSINKLSLNGYNLSLGMGREFLDEFVPYNNNISEVILAGCQLNTESANSFTSAIAQCKNMESLELIACGIDDNSLRLLVSEIRGMVSLTRLDLLLRREVGSVVHQALAALLEDTSCNLRRLCLQSTGIGDECMKCLARSLRGNATLNQLKLKSLTFTEVGWKALSDAVCDASSVNATYLSNHTLCWVTGSHCYIPADVAELLKMNYCEDWKTSAVKKILHAHPHFNMEPFFEWDLSILPHAFQWFAGVQDLARADSNISEANINTRKLDAIYQFARAMPLKFVPVPKVEGVEGKG